MTTPIRLALIGCGGIATNKHVTGYGLIKEQQPDLFNLVAVCDAATERAEAVADRAVAWGQERPRVYGDFEQLLRDGGVDAADICLPHFLHRPVGIACLEAGVHVQIEKPVGVTIKATRQLIEASKRSGAILATAEQIRRMPGPRTAHWAIHEKGMLGTPQVFFVQRANNRKVDPNMPWAWRFDRFLSGGGPVLDSGAHFCDTMRYLWGDCDSVYGSVRRLSEGTFVKGDERVPDMREDTFTALLNFKSGVTGTWTVINRPVADTFNTVMYYGSEGALNDPGDPFHGPRLTATLKRLDGSEHKLGDLYQQYLAAMSADERERVFPYGLTDGFALEVCDFLHSIRDRRPPEIDGEQGLQAKAIACAIYEAAAANQVVRVQDVIDGTYDAYQRPIDERWGTN